MGMHRIIEQMGKDDLDDKVKTKTHEKWLIVTLN